MGSGTPLGRVRGLGSSHEGVHHWWHQKLTAGFNIGLMAWLMISLARRPGYDFATMQAWLSSAWVALPMLLLIASVFYHFRLGLQVVIEDYAHDVNRVVLMVLLNLFVFVVSGVAIFSVLKIVLGSS